MAESAQRRPRIPSVERMVKNLVERGIPLERIVQETTPNGAIRVYVRDMGKPLETVTTSTDWSNAPPFS